MIEFDPCRTPLLTPESIYGPRDKLLDTCIITFSGKLLQYALETWPCREVTHLELCSGYGTIPVYELEAEGRSIGLYNTLIGSTSAGNCLEEVRHLTGAKNYVMFGSAGCLDSEKTGGRPVIPTRAFRDEGLSYHYAPAADYIEMKNAFRVAAAFAGWGVPFVTGGTWTTDAFYRETPDKIRRRREEGCLTVEMECAGIQAVCDWFGLELYDFLLCGDVLDLPEWDSGNLRGANHDQQALHLALRLALAADRGEL